MYKLMYLADGRWLTVAIGDDYDTLARHQRRLYGKTLITGGRK